MINISVIIVSFNTKKLLRKCLASIEKMETGDWRLETIVIDNASFDGSPEMIKKEFSQVKLIANKKNQGFAKANNQALQQAQGEYCLLLNSDTEVKSESLEKLIEFAQNHPEAGVIGARLLNPDGSIQPSAYHFPTLWRAINEYWLDKKGEYEKYAPAGIKPIEVEAVTGAAMLIPKRTIKKICLLDERYFMYFEDLDYCQRVRQVGLNVYYLPKAEILHHHGKSASKVGAKAFQYLNQSSKIYNGILKYWLLTVIIWIGQKWQKVSGRK